MESLALTDLAPPQRLALAYAPRPSRACIAAAMLLDARFARAGSQSSEPIVAQMKLAWWRDQFAQPRTHWRQDEPLLAVLAVSGIPAQSLIALADGWERLLVAETLDETAAAQFAAGRVAMWLGLADGQDVGGDLGAVRLAARRWALADLAAHLRDEQERRMVRELAAADGLVSVRLPRLLRPLAVLDALALRSVRLGRPLLDGMPSLFPAVRVGIFGR